MIIVAFIACSKPIDIVDGTFTYTESYAEPVDTAGADTAETTETEDESSDPLDGLTLVISSLSYTLTLNGDEVSSGALVLRDESDWAVGCPTNFSAEDLMTYNLSPFDVADLSYQNPVIAPTCNGGDVLYLSEYSDEIYDNIGCFSETCLRFSSQ